MSTSITVRDIDAGDKSWLRRAAQQTGVATEEYVRRLIHEQRVKAERRPKPPEAVRSLRATFRRKSSRRAAVA